MKNPLINLSHSCLCSDSEDSYVMGMLMFLVHHAEPIFLQWQLTPLSPAARAGGTGQ